MQRRWTCSAIAVTALLLAGTAQADQRSAKESARASSSLVLGRSTIKGSMPREMIRRRLRLRGGAIERCVELEKAPVVSVTVRFIIAPTGLVLHASLTEGNLSRQVAQQCLIREIRALDFGSLPPGINIVYQPLIYLNPAFQPR
jgi:hypothetical protein